MREIKASDVTSLVKRLFIEANYTLPRELAGLIADASRTEPDPLGREILCRLCENIEAAKTYNVPICQDTGLAVVFVELGQNVHIVGGDFEEAINAGVRAAYLDGYMRCSVVGDPLFSRKNTGDNTPAVIHVKIVPGDRLRITAAPKGFGSENKSAIRMFTPAASPRDVSDFVVDTVLRAGGDPCPPVVVGVGIGGTFESAALDAKRALTLPTTYRNPDERYAELEDELLDRINATGIGPQGFGGRTTALAVNIIARPTHIAGLPVAVNVGCHVTRHAEGEL
ncbi:MAG: fumarate hydratase [Clostridiales bacterium]|jgi:fumarate hydratase subunit alpha|nr:fumarate hydratase [Clostridiales bacterium]